MAIDYFGRKIQVDDLVIYSGSIDSVSHGVVVKITAGVSNVWKVSVRKMGTAHYGPRVNYNGKIVTLTQLNRVVILTPRPTPVKWRLDHRIYAIVRGDTGIAVYDDGEVLNREGKWEWEPQPSSRDEDFLARCRFASLEEAVKAYEDAKAEAIRV